MSARLLSKRPFCRHPCQTFSLPSFRPPLGAHLRRESPVSLQEGVPSLPPRPVGPVWSGPGLLLRPPLPSFPLPTAVLCPVGACPPALLCPLLGTGTPALVTGLSDHAVPAHMAPLGKNFPGRAPTPAPALSPPLISSQLVPSELNLVYLWK